MKKIAVTTENGMIFQHFGKTQTFTIYETENGQILSKNILDAGANGHSALAGLLQQNRVDVLICGGIGQGAKEALKSCGIDIVPGAVGSVDQAVKDYLMGALIGNPDFMCNHHGHEHEGHSCGEHGCGSHSCGHHG